MDSAVARAKTINGTTTGFWYDGNDVYAELSGATPSFTYIRGLNIDEPYIRKGASDEFYETDALGSSVALTNGAGTSQTTYTYEPFSTTTPAGTASTNPFQFTGRENDGTGLYFYRSRYYSPGLTRFISEDPMGLLAGDPNVYGYVRQDPILRTDPSGHIVPAILLGCALGTASGVIGAKKPEQALRGATVGFLVGCSLGPLITGRYGVGYYL